MAGAVAAAELSFLKGKCSACRGRISFRYFFIEAFAAVLFAAAWYLVRPVDVAGGLLLAKDWLFLAAMIVVFVIDLEHYLILDEVVLPIAACLLVLNLALSLSSAGAWWSVKGVFVSGVLAAVAAAAPFFALWLFSGGRWMGFGDVKLALLLGVGLGWPVVFVGLFVAVILGGLASVYLLVFSEKTLKSQIPFGTFLSLASVFCLFYGEKLLGWYLAFLGF